MISISIVTYDNSLSDVEACIREFIHSDLISEVVICENTEIPVLSASGLNKLSSKINFISNPSNTGYGAGHNFAYSLVKSSGLYHVVMNLDVQVNPSTFKSLLDFMEHTPDVLQVMPKVLNKDDSIQRLCKMLPSPINLIVRRFIKNKALLDKIDNKYTLYDYKYDFILDCPYLSGCFMFLRKDAFEKVSGFDENFFMYPEDIDLTRRLHEIGRTVCYPFVSIVHEHAQASYNSRKMLYVHVKGIIKYFNKWGWFVDKKRTKFNKNVSSRLKIKGLK
jgi:GT2 family glycosyltransferase